MDLKGVKPSTRLEDHTGHTPVQKAIDSLSVKLNPVIAARNARGAMIERGWIEPKVKRVGVSNGVR